MQASPEYCDYVSRATASWLKTNVKKSATESHRSMATEYGCLRIGEDFYRLFTLDFDSHKCLGSMTLQTLVIELDSLALKIRNTASRPGAVQCNRPSKGRDIPVARNVPDCLILGFRRHVRHLVERGRNAWERHR